MHILKSNYIILFKQGRSILNFISSKWNGKKSAIKYLMLFEITIYALKLVSVKEPYKYNIICKIHFFLINLITFLCI